MGKEPVHVDGRPAGYVTSAGFGYSVGQAIAYAWLPAHSGATGSAGRRSATSGRRCRRPSPQEPLFDPEMRRLRS